MKGGPIFCIQCAMESIIRDEPVGGLFDESLDEHMARAHPDPAVTQARRVELEHLLVDWYRAKEQDRRNKHRTNKPP